MELDSERLERRQLKTLSTADLVRHALAEAKLLVRAEVLHARKELREELKAARTGGILLGAGVALGLAGATLLLVALAGALPLALWLSALLVGVGVLVVAGVLALLGTRRLPRKPLPHTQERLKADLHLTRETLQ